MQVHFCNFFVVVNSIVCHIQKVIIWAGEKASRKSQGFRFFVKVACMGLNCNLMHFHFFTDVFITDTSLISKNIKEAVRRQLRTHRVQYNSLCTWQCYCDRVTWGCQSPSSSLQALDCSLVSEPSRPRALLSHHWPGRTGRESPSQSVPADGAMSRGIILEHTGRRILQVMWYWILPLPSPSSFSGSVCGTRSGLSQGEFHWGIYPDLWSGKTKTNYIHISPKLDWQKNSDVS